MVPNGLDKLQSTGHTRATLMRKLDDQWIVASIDGDPYIRAVLYQGLTNYLENSANNVAELDQSQFKLITVRPS